MNKKIFSEAEIEVINFDEDVIATSGGTEDKPGGDIPLEEIIGINGNEIDMFSF